jgi:translation initiation factor 5B
MWTMVIVTIVCMTTTSAVLAEVCSALPVSGSIYVWAAAAAGKKYGRLVGFIVGWFCCTAWMTFAAGNCQTTANYLLSLLWVYEVDYPGGLDITNVKLRVLVWGVSEGLLLVVVALNYLPPRAYSWVFKGSMLLMAVDFVICLVWLPIGASRTYGIRTAAEALLTTHNGTGHVAGWNWLLVLIYATGNSIGWDASGHVAEETIDASRVASRGMFWSCLVSSSSAFLATILFLFVTPDIATWETLTAPQPFVQVYALAFGKGGATFMTVLAVVGLSAFAPPAPAPLCQV